MTVVLCWLRLAVLVLSYWCEIGVSTDLHCSLAGHSAATQPRRSSRMQGKTWRASYCPGFVIDQMDGGSTVAPTPVIAAYVALCHLSKCAATPITLCSIKLLNLSTALASITASVRPLSWLSPVYDPVSPTRHSVEPYYIRIRSCSHGNPTICSVTVYCYS